MKKYSAAINISIILGVMFFCAQLKAQETKTVPVGLMTITADGAVGGVPKVTSLSIPLGTSAIINGQSVGRITSVSADSISNSAANWTQGELSQVTTPFMIKITSGAALGRTFLISTATQNTSTTLFIDGEDANLVDLTSLGISVGANGDTYEISQCDTLLEFLGTPATTGVVGGNSSNGADIVTLLRGGAWKDYYYNTSLATWAQVGTNIPSNNIPIRPDAALSYRRVSATPLKISLVGKVPNSQRQVTVLNSGKTYISNGWPLDTTLNESNIQQIPGWVTSANPNLADTVAIFTSGAWRTYYHNGSQWLRAGPNTPSNGIPISSQGGIVLQKRGAMPGAAILTQALPYSL